MNKDRNIELWVDALRSGLYEQGYGNLRKDDMFCCLGVACEVYQKEIGSLAVETNGLKWAYDGYTYSLPSKVQVWLGLANGNGRFNEVSSLSVMNDGGYSFEEIADFIESCPSGLFIKEEENTNE